MASQCVVVIGGPRAGTSLAAGVLHRLGYFMGDDLGGDGGDWNPLGFFEDGEFSDLYSRMVFGDGCGSMEEYMPKTARLTPELKAKQAALIASRCSRFERWGIKSARLAYVLDDFDAVLNGCPLRVIRMLRDENDMAASWAARAGVTIERAKATISNAVRAADKAIVGRKTLTVNYNDVLDFPGIEIGRIADFCGISSSDAIASAAGFVMPALQRFRANG